MKNCIKHSVKILAASAAVILIEIFTGAVLYMALSLCSALVAGQKVSVFNLHFFVRGIMTVLPAAIFLSPVFISFYLIRHKEIAGIPIFVCIAGIFCLWLFAVPGLKKPGAAQPFMDGSQQAQLSSGYFRSSADGRYIFYYSEITPQNSASGVCIDTRRIKDKVFTFSGIQFPRESAFSDPLIQSSLEMPYSLKSAFSLFSAFIKTARSKSQESMAEWLCFSSVIAAFLSVIWLRNISMWRLVNVLLIAVVFAAVLLVNSFLLPTEVFARIALPKYIARAVPAGRYIIAAVNCGIFAMALAAGAVASMLRKNSSALDFAGDGYQ